MYQCCSNNYNRSYNNGFGNYFWLGIFFIIALFFLATPFGGGFLGAGLLI